MGDTEHFALKETMQLVYISMPIVMMGLFEFAIGKLEYAIERQKSGVTLEVAALCSVYWSFNTPHDL